MNKTLVAVERRRMEILQRRGNAEIALSVIECRYGIRDQNGTPTYSNFYSSNLKQRILEIASAEDRREAIRLHREITKCSNDFQDLEIERTRAELHEARAYGTIAQEVVPIIVGLLFVWIGSQIYGVVGAIGGAVVGIFAGFSYVRQKDAERKSFVAMAERDLESEIQEKQHHYPLRYLFTEEELHELSSTNQSRSS